MMYNRSVRGTIFLFHTLFCSSLAFSSAERAQIHHLWGSHRSMQQRGVCFLSASPSEVATEEKVRTDNDLVTDERQCKRTIMVESALIVPVSQTTAFDAFSDLSRQVEYSPWLRSVQYLDPPKDGVDTRGKDLGETKWTMAYMGVRFSWNSVVSRLERPHTLEWESTSGMKNFGKVHFDAIDDSNTKVTFQMSFVAPRLVAVFFKRSSIMAHFVQDKVIRTTLINFRDTVANESSSQ